MTRSRLYLWLPVACIAGYAWLIFSFQAQQQHQLSPCLFKSVTGIPCPSCGTTRSILALLHSDLPAALYINPLGFPALLLLTILPLLLIADLLLRRQYLWNAYRHMERWLQKRPVALTLLLLILTNWIWNISKGL